MDAIQATCYSLAMAKSYMNLGEARTMNTKSYSNLLESLCSEHARSETGLVLLQILNDPLDTLRIFWELLIVRFIPFYHLFYDGISSVS